MAFVNLKKFKIPVEVKKVSEKSAERSAETAGEIHVLNVEVSLFSHLFNKGEALGGEQALEAHEAYEKLMDGFRLLNEGQTPELRVDFGPLFTLFFKVKEDSSKMLIAHPDENEYVATVILTKQQMGNLQSSFLDKSPIVVESLGRFTKMSNLKLRFM